MFTLLLELILMLAGIFAVVVSSFVATCFCVGLLTDCDMDEAAKRVREFLRKWFTKYIDKKKTEKFLTYEVELANEIEANIRNVVGETAYKERYNLALSADANRVPLLLRCYHSGMSCIEVSVYCADDNTKQRLESLLKNKVVKYLWLSRCATRVLPEWTMRDDLALPVLRLCFALTTEEKEALNQELADRSAKIIAKNAPVVDDTEEVDLF